MTQVGEVEEAARAGLEREKAGLEVARVGPAMEGAGMEGLHPASQSAGSIRSRHR